MIRLSKTPARPIRGRHIVDLRQLRSHVADPSKHAAYRELLQDYGISSHAFEALHSHPRLIYAEQPGCWFYAEDVLRARLLRGLLDTGEFHASSGVLSLCLDAFSDRGSKRSFATFRLDARVADVHLLGATYRRRHRHRVYAALPLDRDAHRRLRQVFSRAADMLEAARVSARTFADEMNARFQVGVPKGLRPMLPPACDRSSLVALARELRRCDLDAALRTLAIPCCELRRDVTWSEFWNAVNRQFFGVAIEPLGALYNRFLTAVEDPVRLATSLRADLLRVGGCDPRRDVSVAAVVTPEDKYRMVFFDQQGAGFYYLDGGEGRRPIGWEAVRDQAAAGRSGGPSGVLAYLLMAASGVYLVSDTVDGTSPFERAARRIHQIRTGLCFPSVAAPCTSDAARGGLLRICSPSFEACSRVAVERFLD